MSAVAVFGAIANTTRTPAVCAFGSQASSAVFPLITFGFAGSQKIETRFCERPMSVSDAKKAVGSSRPRSSLTPIESAPWAAPASASVAHASANRQAILVVVSPRVI